MEGETLSERLTAVADWEIRDSGECQRVQDEIDDAVYRLYRITEEDRRLIERELGEVRAFDEKLR